MGWNQGTRQITSFANSSRRQVNIIKSYSQIDKATLKSACERLCKPGGVDSQTLAAKLAFKQYMAEHRVKILHYHFDNRCFHDNAFWQACHDARQQLTFCGVNAHFQNGIAEQDIQDLSESARKQLLHTCACWPEVVHFALWPYALWNAAYLHSNLPVLEDGTSRLELFSSIQVGSYL